MAADEARVGQDVDGMPNAADQRRIAACTRYSPASTMRIAVGAVAAHGALDLAREAAAVAARVEPDVIDRPALVLQLGGEVAHRREDEGDLLLVMTDISGLVPHLHHQDDGPCRILPIEAGNIVTQLVAEDGHEGLHDRANARTG